MMSDFKSSELFPLSEAAKRLPTGTRGKPVSVGTLHRWSKQGVAGVRLETVCVGMGTYTSAEALDRFISGVTEARSGRKDSPSSAPSKAAERASMELERAGI